MEWMCGSCYSLVHPHRHQRGMTTRDKKKCVTCGREAICEMALGETIEKALQLLEKGKK